MVHDAILKQQLWIWSFVRDYFAIQALSVIVNFYDVLAVPVSPPGGYTMDIWIQVAKFRKSYVRRLPDALLS